MLRSKDAGAAAGFSLMEAVVAMGLMLAVTAAVLAVLGPTELGFRVRLESMDVEQRLRVAADALTRDLVQAGAGSQVGQAGGPLVYSFAPILPFRRGVLDDDPPATFRPDVVTLLYVPDTPSQGILAEPLGAALELRLAATGCPTAAVACGLAVGDTALVHDESGAFDTFTVTALGDGFARIRPHTPDGTLERAYPPGALVSEVVQHTYYLKTDPAAGFSQLMRYDGSANPGVPVVDNVVGLTFEYYGTAHAPTLVRPLETPQGPWTSYGPKPPPAGVSRTPFAAGENCVFSFDAGTATVVPRLADLAGGHLRRLLPEELIDGPFWCPDAGSSRRYDADLLRIRRVDVVLRVQSAMAALRGPANALFAYGGTAHDPRQFLPDREIRITVTPRNHP